MWSALSLGGILYCDGEALSVNETKYRSDFNSGYPGTHEDMTRKILSPCFLRICAFNAHNVESFSSETICNNLRT